MDTHPGWPLWPHQQVHLCQDFEADIALLTCDEICKPPPPHPPSPSFQAPPLPEQPLASVSPFQDSVTPRLAALAAPAQDLEADLPHLIAPHMCKPLPPAAVSG